jgi:prolipoprotein diacylglyceryltransferase
MLTEKFDAYGEPLPDVSPEQREAAKAASAVLSRIGQYVFWLLVIVIVSARIFYYPASPASQFHSANQATHAVMR